MNLPGVDAGLWQGKNRTLNRSGPAAEKQEPCDETALPAADGSEPDDEPAELPDERNAMGKKNMGILVAVCVLTGVCIYAVISFLPGAFRYRNVPVAESDGDEIIIDGTMYVFYGPVEDGVKRGKLVAYARDDDGCVTEFYTVKGDDGETLIAWHRTLMGDRWMVTESQFSGSE